MRLPENLGFAGGINRGLELARGDDLILINQDVVLRASCLAALSAQLADWPNRLSVANCYTRMALRYNTQAASSTSRAPLPITLVTGKSTMAAGTPRPKSIM